MAPTSARSNGEGAASDSTVIIVLLLGLFLSLILAWLVFHTRLAMVYTYIRRAELGWLDSLGALGLPGASDVSDWFRKGCAAKGMFQPCTRDFSTMSWTEIRQLSFYTNVLLLPLITLVAWRIFIRVQINHPRARFSKIFTVDTLISAKKTLYPHLNMFEGLDLISAPLNHPQLGMSQTSRQFVYHHRLILESSPAGDGWIEEKDGSVTPVLNRGKAARVLREQLGRHWSGVKNLTHAETLILAIVIPRVAATDSALDDTAFKKCLQESDAMIDWCWKQFCPPPQGRKKNQPSKKARRTDQSLGADKTNHTQLTWLHPNIDLSVPLATIDRYIRRKPVLDILVKHAYRQTILFAMFITARSLGVLHPAQIRWLRFYDRTLWYVVQNFGRQAVFAEGCAAFTHYLYEVRSGQALIEPQLDKAIDALESALTAFKYTTSDRDAYRNSAPLHSTQENLSSQPHNFAQS